MFCYTLDTFQSFAAHPSWSDVYGMPVILGEQIQNAFLSHPLPVALAADAVVSKLDGDGHVRSHPGTLSREECLVGFSLTPLLRCRDYRMISSCSYLLSVYAHTAYGVRRASFIKTSFFRVSSRRSHFRNNSGDAFLVVLAGR